MSSGQRLRSALRAHPLAVDAMLAGVIFVVTLTAPQPDAVPGHPTPTAAVALAAAAALMLAVRRRWPRVTLAVTVVITSSAVFLAQGRPVFTVGVAIALYTVAVRAGRRTTVLAAVATALILATAALIAPTGERLASPVDLMSPLLGWVGISAAIGDAVRNRRAYIAAIEDRAVRAEETREEEARRQVAEERLRIARELHDVVAHHVAVVSVQAGLAQHLVFKQPHGAHEALKHVQQASAAILDELGGILNILRRPDESTATPPAPGLHLLDALVTSYTEAGLEATWSLSGHTRAVSGMVDLVAYRVVQEALTNAHKYGTGTAHVSVRYTPSSLYLEVTNPMCERRANAHGTGHGLVGMRERATAVGGVLQAGPGPHKEFKVSATLPVLQPGAS